MAIDVQIKDPAANGDPVPKTLKASLVVPVTGKPIVTFYLIDEATGTESPPLPAKQVSGLWEASSGGHTVSGNLYTVVAIAVHVIVGVSVDTGSDTKNKCKAP